MHLVFDSYSNIPGGNGQCLCIVKALLPLHNDPVVEVNLTLQFKLLHIILLQCLLLTVFAAIS